jgi:hypothetical protein
MLEAFQVVTNGAAHATPGDLVELVEQATGQRPQAEHAARLMVVLVGLADTDTISFQTLLEVMRCVGV